MIHHVCKTIEKYNLLALGDGVVVACSGGADSVVLLAGLIALRDDGILQSGASTYGEPLRLYAVHVNHGLRESAGADEQFVRELCATWGIPLRVFAFDVRAEADRAKSGIEETARRLRYAALCEAAVDWNAQKIATGHNADDNAETVLMNLCRGAGLRGLCGIAPKNGNIIRPLIETTRAEIEAYLMRETLTHITDDSNKSLEYTRNRIRQIILPALREHVNPHSGENIARSATLLYADADFLDHAAREAFQSVYNTDEPDQSGACLSPIRSMRSTDENNKHSAYPPSVSDIVLYIPRLLALHEALKNRVIREAIARVGPQLKHTQGEAVNPAKPDFTDIHARHITAALDIAGGTTGREAQLPGVTVRRSYENLYFSPRTPAENCTRAVTENFTGTVTENNTRAVTENNTRSPIKNFSHPPAGETAPAAGFFYPIKPGTPLYIPERNQTFTLTIKNTSPCTQAAEYVTLSLRTRRPGDRIRLPVGTKKIQDLFTDRKIPRHKRDTIPLIAAGSQVLWVENIHATGCPFQVTVTHGTPYQGGTP